MTDRDELIKAGAKALLVGGMDAWESMSVKEMSTRVLDAVEPLIRADEREFLTPEVPWARDDLRNELRAKVAAMRYTLVAGSPVVFKDEVLALFDGGSDG